MTKKEATQEPKHVSLEQIRALTNAMRAMADSCDDALERMKNAGLEQIGSTNYASSLRGFELVLRFVEGIAGTATTSQARDIIAPVLKEKQAIAELVEPIKKSAAKSRRSKDKS